jgi:hypothetical protein
MTPRTDSGRRGARWGLAGNPRFLLLWFPMLISAIGSFLLLLTVSANLVVEHGSSLLGSLVFAVPWILPIIALRQVGSVTAAGRVRRTIVGSELCAGACSIACAFSLSHRFVAGVLVLLAARGLFEAVTKNGRTVLVGALFDSSALPAASYLFNSSYYLGGALGGVLGQGLAGHLPIAGIGLLDAATYCVSALCYFALARMSPQDGPARASGRREPGRESPLAAILANPRCVLYAASLLVSVGLFQGYFNCVRTLMPVAIWGRSGLVMYVQIIASSGILLGVLIAPLVGRLRQATPWLCVALCIVNGAVLFVPLFAGMQLGSAGLFLFLVIFELIFTLAQGGLIQELRLSGLSHAMSLINAAAVLLLIASTIGFGVLADLHRYLTAAILFLGCVLALCSLAALAWRASSHRLASARTTCPPLSSSTATGTFEHRG